MLEKRKIIRITTVPISLEKLLENQLSFMNDYFEVIAVSSEKERLDRFAQKNNIRSHHIEMTRTISPLKDLSSLLKMYRFLKKEKPAIVHSHTPKAGTIGMLAARLAGVPNRFHTVAGLPLLESSGFKRRLLNFVEKITYKCATRIYPNSSGLREIIVREKFCKEEKLKVIAKGSSNGINTTYYSDTHFTSEDKENLREKLGIKASDFVFIFVGRIVSDKGINELVNAFEKLMTLYPQAKLLLVGTREDELDPLDKSVLNLIESNENIIELGFQEDVRPFFAISEVLVFPSYREGFPNVVLQAGAMAVPSIVSDINGCNEIIVDKENGLIIPVKNEIAIFEAMQFLMQNETVLAEMSAKTLLKISEKYEQKFVWKEILTEYQSFFNEGKNLKN